MSKVEDQKQRKIEAKIFKNGLKGKKVKKDETNEKRNGKTRKNKGKTKIKKGRKEEKRKILKDEK